MSTRRHGLAVAAVDDTLYAIAGSTRGNDVQHTDSVEALPPATE